MSLQLCPAPLFLSNTPFCGPSTCTHLDRSFSPGQTKQFSVTSSSGMNNTGVVSLPLVLDGATFGVENNKVSASPSPGAQSASIATTASPYPPPPSSTSSMHMISPDTSLDRDPKLPQGLDRQSSATVGSSTDLANPTENQSMDCSKDHLDMNYSQTSEIGSQTSSAMGVVASSTIRNDTYPTVGTPYWNSNFLGAGTMDKSTSEDGDTNNGLGNERQMPSGGHQMYGNGVTWGEQDMPMSMNSMQQYVPRRMTNGSWDTKVPQHQQLQQPHQQVQPDSSLVSPYDSASTTNNLQVFGDYSMVNGPTHRIVPSNFGTSGGNSAPSTPHQSPGAATGWPQSSFGSNSNKAGSSIAPMSNNQRAPTNMRGGRLGSTVLGKDIKPKILASSAASLPKKSPIQQSATARSERAKTGDRTTHNDVERKYRTNLKDRIAELRAAVPALQAQQDGESDGKSDGTTSHHAAAPKVSKGTVLSKATEYIQQLEQANRAMMSEHQQLVERLQTLEAMLQAGGLQPPQFTPNHGLTLFDPRAFN